MRRREFVTVSILFAASCARRSGFDPEEAGIASLAGFGSQELVRAYLRRIEAIDRAGPRLNSVIELNPDALFTAGALDEERRAKGPRSPLHGVPILIKDNLDTADKMKTTAGSLALENAPTPKQDAPVVARLRRAGAVILGKTNLSEWANIRSPRSTSGWSARGGLTRNPYALDRNTSGSSSGSAAAAAASLCAAAVGTETDGSIVSPSSLHGLVGIKPTVGHLSGRGIIPIARSQDTVGPIARSVRDAVLLLSVMNDSGVDYSSFLDPNGLKGARLGVARQHFGGNPEVARIARTSLELCARLGAEVVDPVELPPTSLYGDAELEVLLFELKAGLNAYLAERGGRVRTLREVIEFNQKNAAREMPYFGQELFIKAEEKGGLGDKAYIAARKQCMAAGQGIDSAVQKHGLDAIVAPTDGPAWLTDFINGDHYYPGGCSSPPAVAGYPHITVTAGDVHGLPIGLSFFGPANSDGRLIRCAYAFEQAAKARRAPTYRASVEVS